MPQNRGTRKRIAQNIYEDRYGFEIIVTWKGIRREKRMPKSSARTDVTTERDRMRHEIRMAALRADTTGTLATDAATYLDGVKHMPSYAARQHYVGMWVDTLGTRQRSRITVGDVTGCLGEWRQSYSAQTCNHLRTALSQVYSTLDGPDARNPAKAVKKYRTPKDEARNIPIPAVLKILRQFRSGSKTRARLALMVSTGITQAEMMRLKPSDIHLDAKAPDSSWIQIGARRKGQGSEARSVPLTKHGRRAVRLFIRLDAFGTFSTASMRSRFHDACRNAGFVIRDNKKADGLDWRPYDLRHTLATEVAKLSGDERAVQAILGHTDLSTTRRYTQGSVPDRVNAAMALMNGKR